jgi:hypothetical protein
MREHWRREEEESEKLLAIYAGSQPGLVLVEHVLIQIVNGRT